MIDNFEQISKLLKFENEEEFYFIQVLQRNKENPELGSNNRLIKAYYIDSLAKLDKYKLEMIKLATVFNARVYIHLNRRNKKMIALEMLEDLAHCIKSNQFELSKIYNTACGRHHSEKDKTWIVDLDEILWEEQVLNAIWDCEPVGNKIKAKIPTKNGVHFITSAFNSQKFQENLRRELSEYQMSDLKVDIHKNNPTILYVP